MSQTVPPSIDASPVAPDRADRTTFSSRATAWADWLKNAISQIAAVALNAYDNSVDAYSSAVSAAASAVAASSGASAAIAASNVTEWVSGTYTAGDCVYSPINFHTYRCKTTGVRSTDPSLDTAHWQILTYDPAQIDPTNKTAAYTASAGDMCGQDTSGGSFLLTLPASPVIGDPPVLVHDRGKTFNTFPLTVDGNGEKVYGSTEQLTIRRKGLIAQFIYCGSSAGWELM